jgi:hypothetical protein
MGSYWFWSLSDSVWESNIYSPIIWHLLACQFSMIRRLALPCRNRQNLQSQNMSFFFKKKRSSVSSITVMFNKLKLKYKADASKSLYMLDKYELWQTGHSCRNHAYKTTSNTNIRAEIRLFLILTVKIIEWSKDTKRRRKYSEQCCINTTRSYQLERYDTESACAL